MRRGPGVVGMVARTAVVAGTATAVSGRVARRQANRYADKDAQYVAQQQAAVQQDYQEMAPAQAAPMPAAPPQADPYEQIEKLAKLHTEGAITDEEFSAAKAKILGT